MNNSVDVELIAPCGMNCGVCLGHLRAKNTCPGCRIHSDAKPKTRSDCKIKTCSLISATESGFCFDCQEYPCKRLKQLDKRYRTKYNMSMIENLDHIKRLGIDLFLQNERERWRCHYCGGLICVHLGVCLSCVERQKMN